jgi:hypothetical protein
VLTTSKLSSRFSYRHFVRRTQKVCLNEVCYSSTVMDERERSVSDTGVKNLKWRNGHPCYDSSVLSSISERGVDLARAKKRIWKTDESKFWFYPRAWRRLSEKWAPLFTKIWESQFYIHTKHWSCSIANAQNAAQAELDITKFLYTWLTVPCCLMEENKFEVLKLLF